MNCSAGTITVDRANVQVTTIIESLLAYLATGISITLNTVPGLC